MKICPKCKKEFNLDSFSVNKAKKDGLQSYCKVCHKLEQKKYYNNKKEYYKTKAKIRTKKIKEEFKNYKKLLKCYICSESESCCLDFHHKDKNFKENEISRLVAIGATKSLNEELKKCIVLCANCHRKVHANLIILDISPIA